MARKDILTKTCTKTGQVFTGTFEELTEFFYRDKSQKDGLSPWSKDAERAYNKAYRAGLEAAGAPRKRDIDGEEGVVAFEETMAPERVTRKRGTVNRNEAKTQKAARKQDGKRTAKAKATTKTRKAQRKTKQAQA